MLHQKKKNFFSFPTPKVPTVRPTTMPACQCSQISLGDGLFNIHCWCQWILSHTTLFNINNIPVLQLFGGNFYMLIRKEMELFSQFNTANCLPIYSPTSKISSPQTQLPHKTSTTNAYRLSLAQTHTQVGIHAQPSLYQTEFPPAKQLGPNSLLNNRMTHAQTTHTQTRSWCPEVIPCNPWPGLRWRIL